ncbi:MAG: PAS domain S-box protein [Enterobacteriaceae bacterium]|nr:PAS domain S-box protein [Enterobacteriaceae bacterium]
MMNEKTRPYFHEVDEKHLFDLLNHNSDWLWEVDAEGRYTWVSGVVTELLGYPPEEVLGRTPFDFMPPEEAERVGLAFMDIVTAKRAFSGLVNRNRRADGTIVVLETSGIPLFDEQGNLSGYRGIDRNISTLGERVLQLETIYDTTPVALCMIDIHGRIVMSNKAMTRLLASAPSNAVTDYFPDVMPECWQQFLQDFSGARHGADIPSREVMFAERYYYTQPVPVYDAMDNVVGLSVTWVDITARRQAEQKLANANLVLKQFAQLDHLTGLFNRRHMDEFLIQQIAHALEQGLPLSICLADIDFFKNFNDSQGHQSGDDCLRAVKRWHRPACVRKTISAAMGAKSFW